MFSATAGRFRNHQGGEQPILLAVYPNIEVEDVGIATATGATAEVQGQ
jgi:hypothetical protein